MQGVQYYQDADPDSVVPGLMHVRFGEYHVSDIQFVAAFDVDAKKVGFDLSEAIGASENNTIKICDVPPAGVPVQRGHTLDGQGIPSSETPAPALPFSQNLVATDAPPLRLKSEGLEPTRVGPYSVCRYDFDAPQLPIDFQWLRTPFPEELFSLSVRPGFLRLHGCETMGSVFRHSLVARRQQSHCFRATTVVEFEPDHFQQMAGLVCYYNSTKLHYLHISHDEILGKHLRVMSCIPDTLQADAFTPPIPIAAGRPVHLRVEVDCERLHFGYRVEGVDHDWCWLPEQFDASILSDEATAPGQANFTGAFVGMACEDMSGTAKPADFDFFQYEERAYHPTPFA